MSVESDDDQNDAGDLISGADDDTLDQIVSAVADQVTNQVSATNVEKIVSGVIDSMKDEFPELEIRSRDIGDIFNKFKKKKLASVESKSQYQTKLDYIEQYFEEEIEVNTTDELSSEDIEEFADWRKYESLDRDDPLSDVTLKDDLYLYRQFVEYMVKHKLVPHRYVRHIEIPSLDYQSGEGVDDKLLSPELAKASLNHLRRYHYASRDHTAMEIFCATGRRPSGVHGLDVKSYESKEQLLKFEHSDETPLKRRKNSEREIKLPDNVAQVIEEYIEHNRLDVVDENGRNPLLTTNHGRISLSTLKKIAYRWTRPCEVGLDCPHNRDPTDCDAALVNNEAFRCPSSRAPKHIRTGYITDRRNAGVSAEAIDYQCNVTPEVQRLHYDHPAPEDERERYIDEFENASAPDSGFG